LPVKLLIVGGESDDPDPIKTPEIGRLQDVAKKENVLNDVIFIGRKGRDQLRFYYNAADVFVSTPWYEPFGITPLEAMACRTPVIGSNVGGIKFTVINGKTGFLIPPKDPQALSEKLEKILTDNKKSAILSENAMKRVNDFFTWTTITDALHRVYEKVLYSQTSPLEEYEILIDTVNENFDSFLSTIKSSQQKLNLSVARASRVIASVFLKGGSMYICGNGGSAADAQHFAAELVGHFKINDRAPLPALSLTNDISVFTALGNDFSFDDIFARQIDAYGKKGDVLVAISTSGNSRNILNALQCANKKNMICIALTGKNGGKMIEHCDVSIIVPSDNTQRIQEIHTHLIHSLSELIELQVSEPKGTSLHPLIGLKNGRASHILKNNDEK